MTPIHIEIWSDLVCPFCYIGKRHLEAALAQFGREKAKITWKSFELDPAEARDTQQDVYHRLAGKYGQSLDWAKESVAQITQVAASAGLTFNLERAVPANTFNAHRLTHLAAKHGLDDATEERFMTAHFSEGRNLADPETLKALAADVGLPAGDVDALLAGDAFAIDVRKDEQEAFNGGIRAVPFFLFNRKYAVRGAQPVETFLSALHQVEEDR